jgi:hypothetical protein
LLALAVPALASGSGSLREGGRLAPISPSITTGSWSATASMTTARRTATATRLASGRVLVVGGAEVSTAELYDPPPAPGSLRAR